MKTLKTVTIGIPAHNEEANIGNLLQQIIDQKKQNFKLESVIVACDGCTDNTAKIVKEFAKKHKTITVINDGKRKGKAGRLNDFYKLNSSDVILTFDADIILATDSVISEIVKCFNNSGVGLVGGNSLPLKPKTFFEHIVYRWLMMWFELRKNLNKGINVHNHMGCISALSRKFAANIVIPNADVPDDNYLYLLCQKLGFTFKFSNSALVYYKSVDNLKEFLTQHGRYIQSKQYAANYFGQWANEKYTTPISKKFISISKSFLHDPLFTPLALLFQVVLRMNKLESKKDKNFWDTASSSKTINADNNISIRRNSSLFTYALGYIVLYIKMLRGKTEEKPLSNIANYILYKEINRANETNKFSIGLYKKDNKKYFIKTWHGSIKDMFYHFLLNEYQVNLVLYQLLHQHKDIIGIRTPRAIEFVTRAQSASLVMEFIEGKPIKNLPSKIQMQIITNVMKDLELLSKKITNTMANKLHKRTKKSYVSLLILETILLLIKSPNDLFIILRMFFSLLISLIRTQQTKLVLSHRDLTPNNVMIKNKKTYLIDCEQVALTLPGHDLCYLAINKEFPSLMKQAKLSLHTVKNKFIRNFLIMQLSVAGEKFFSIDREFLNQLYE